MPNPRSLPVIVLLGLAGPALAAADDRGGDPAQDQTLVIARSVMPRVAYRGLEADRNPVKVQSTIFPGRVFHGTLDGMLGSLVGDRTLGESAAPAAPAVLRDRPQALDPGMTGVAAGGASAGAPLGAAGSAGGAVLRATGGLADTITATLRASPIGGGR